MVSFLCFNAVRDDGQLHAGLSWFFLCSVAIFLNFDSSFANCAQGFIHSYLNWKKYERTFYCIGTWAFMTYCTYKDNIEYWHSDINDIRTGKLILSSLNILQIWKLLNFMLLPATLKAITNINYTKSNIIFNHFIWLVKKPSSLKNALSRYF